MSAEKRPGRGFVTRQLECSLKYLDYMSLPNSAQLMLFYGKSGDVIISLQN